MTHPERSALKELIHNNDELFSQICIFNTDLARIIDPSHLEGFIDLHLFEKLRASIRPRHKLSALLLKKFELDTAFCFDFQEPSRRLALLEKPILKSLLLHAGASYFSKGITHIIQKQELLELKETIGDDAYLFALKKAPFLIKDKPDLPKELTQAEASPLNIVKAGQTLFQYCLAGAPLALTERFRLRFNAQLSWTFIENQDTQRQQQAWNLLYKILTTEVAPHTKLFFK